jgi:hypothetical protein
MPTGNFPDFVRVRVQHLTTIERREHVVPSQQHETMSTLISGLNVTRYQGLLKAALSDTERQAIQRLLGEEELWLKQNMPKAD